MTTLETPTTSLTKAPLRSEIGSLLLPESFLWATGIEDTFVFDPHHTTKRMLDEYELTKHYEHCVEDIELIASLGVKATRYGIPWYRIEPERSKFDWSFPDQAIDTLLDRGVDPIIDLIHYSVPSWIDQAWLNPDFPKYMADYATAVAERYKGRVHWYTPLNEPRITAHYCGRIGWWPPYRFGWKGLVEVLVGICKGIVSTHQALDSVDPEIVRFHVDATDFYEPLELAAGEAAFFRQNLVTLPIDLIMGRVVPGHPLYSWIRLRGASDLDLQWFRSNAIEPDIIGINLYPMFSRRQVLATKTGVRFRAKYGDRHFVYETAKLYWEKFRRPLMISETAAKGSIRRRSEWLVESMAAVRQLRAEGIPLVGYTWWPLFSLVSWGYRQGDLDLERYLVKMGLWDLVGPELKRIKTPVADEYAQMVGDGFRSAGRLSAVEGRKV